jgi:hypothetical protein
MPPAYSYVIGDKALATTQHVHGRMHIMRRPMQQTLLEKATWKKLELNPISAKSPQLPAFQRHT